MIRIAVIAAALSLVLAIPAMAQTATAPGGGTVGSATLSNGFPAGGGAIALPSQPASPGISGGIASPAGGTAASPGTTAQSAGGGSSTSGTATTTGSTGGGRGGAAAPSGAAGTTSGGGLSSGGGRGGSGVGGNWVVCPPAGASGIAPFLTGTDLSCAPD
jgi:hypothetical protein